MAPANHEKSDDQRPCRVNRDTLRQAPLLRGLSDRELDRVASTTCHWYSRWEKIAYPREEPNTIFLVASGYARLHDTSSEGEELTLALLAGGQICGAPLVPPPAGSNILLQALTGRTLIYRIP